MALDLNKQIEITESVIKDFVKTKGFRLKVLQGVSSGLCSYFMTYLDGDKLKYSEISLFLPLFKREYANDIHQTNNSGFWYSINPYDYESRLKFLSWMLDELNKQLLANK